MKIETKYWLGDRVQIVDLEITAIVNQICIAISGTTYQVHWFSGGDRKEGWLHEDELVPSVKMHRQGLFLQPIPPGEQNAR